MRGCQRFSCDMTCYLILSCTMLITILKVATTSLAGRPGGSQEERAREGGLEGARGASKGARSQTVRTCANVQHRPSPRPVVDVIGCRYNSQH